MSNKPTILVAGASRGIGLEFVRQFGEAGWSVHATARDSRGYAQIEAEGGIPYELDIRSDASIAALEGKLRGIALDAVIANAGITGDIRLAPDDLRAQDMLDVIETNTISALMLVTSLKPNLLAGSRRLALGMSSLMSSISANNWGTQYNYRASKTALNATWRSLAEQWRGEGITCALLRPGFVKTDMTDFQGMDVEVSVAGMVSVVQALTLRDSGRAIGYDGKDIPW